jgi:hypothetical protein
MTQGHDTDESDSHETPRPPSSLQKSFYPSPPQGLPRKPGDTNPEAADNHDDTRYWELIEDDAEDASASFSSDAPTRAFEPLEPDPTPTETQRSLTPPRERFMIGATTVDLPRHPQHARPPSAKVSDALYPPSRPPIPEASSAPTEEAGAPPLGSIRHDALEEIFRRWQELKNDDQPDAGA